MTVSRREERSFAFGSVSNRETSSRGEQGEEQRPRFSVPYRKMFSRLSAESGVSCETVMKEPGLEEDFSIA